MEPPEKKFYGFHYSKQKRIKFYKLGIICGILHLEYLKMRVKKVNIFKDIELENLNSINIFFRFTKVQYFVYALTWPDS